MQTSDSNPEEENPFGFERTSAAREKIRNIRPTEAGPIPDMDRIDEIAGKAGFHSREPVMSQIAPPLNKTEPQPSAAQPTLPINMRVPADVAVVFKKFCKDDRYSYPEGLAEIMKRAGMLPR